MSDEQGIERRMRIRYDPTINAGHILTMLTVALSVIIWGLRLEGRVDGEERARSAFIEQYRIDLQRADKAMDELKLTGRRIEDKVDNLRWQQQRPGSNQ